MSNNSPTKFRIYDEILNKAEKRTAAGFPVNQKILDKYFTVGFILEKFGLNND